MSVSVGEMVRDIDATLAIRGNAADLVTLMQRHLSCDVLGDPAAFCSLTGYTRKVLHAGDGWTLLALGWLPGQMSPIHRHRAWCTFAVASGWLCETLFEARDGSATPVSCTPLRQSDTGHSIADSAFYHRIANLGSGPAVSIHVYGVSADHLSCSLNEVWAGKGAS